MILPYPLAVGFEFIARDYIYCIQDTPTENFQFYSLRVQSRDGSSVYFKFFMTHEEIEQMFQKGEAQ